MELDLFLVIQACKWILIWWFSFGLSLGFALKFTKSERWRVDDNHSLTPNAFQSNKRFKIWKQIPVQSVWSWFQILNLLFDWKAFGVSEWLSSTLYLSDLVNLRANPKLSSNQNHQIQIHLQAWITKNKSNSKS